MERTLEERVRRVEDQLAIQHLVHLYGFVMDERDLTGLSSLYTRDARLRTEDRAIDASGIDEIAAAYGRRYAVLGATYHVAHSVLIDFDENDGDLARGLVASHAEVVRQGETMLVALRYQDVYRRTDAGWRFADRTMSYLYYTPASEYVETMKSADRNRASTQRREADWPWVLHRGDLGQLRQFYPRS